MTVAERVTPSTCCPPAVSTITKNKNDMANIYIIRIDDTQVYQSNLKWEKNIERREREREREREGQTEWERERERERERNTRARGREIGGEGAGKAYYLCKNSLETLREYIMKQ